MKGFKHTGRGPKMGHSFSSKAGFSGSTGRTQSVRGYTRGVPKRKFADGGMVVVKGTDGGSALTRRAKPVTGFDAEAGGKGPLRPGFSKGGKACYAEGGKVATTGAAIKMMKELMKRGNSAEDAASKAARRYGVSPSAVKSPSGPTGGGGLPAEKQMLAKGGMAGMVSRAAAAAAKGYQEGQASGQPVKVAPRNAGPIKGPMGRAVAAAAARAQGQPAPATAKGPLGRAVGRAAGAVQQGFAPAPQGQKVPQATGRVAHHGYGSFGRRPVVG
jgi:hypothetical protein